MPRQKHNYESEYDEYDAYLHVEDHDSEEELYLTIMKTFKLPENSAKELANSLWDVKEIPKPVRLPPIPLFYGKDRPVEGLYVKRGKNSAQPGPSTADSPLKLQKRLAAKSEVKSSLKGVDLGINHL